MLDVLHFVFSSPWVFFGVVLLALIGLIGLLLIALVVAGFAPSAGQAPQTLPRRDPWS